MLHVHITVVTPHFLLPSLHTHTLYSTASVTPGIVITPRQNYTIPINSNDNNTYRCTVTGDRRAIWEINNRQISSQQARDDFSAIGVFVTGTLGSATTDLVFTREGRDTYLALNQSSIPIRCTAFDNNRPVTEFGELFFIFIYGEICL